MTRFTTADLAVLFITLCAISQPASAQVMDDADAPPPPLPRYTQPPLPAQGLLWIPGFWAYDRIWSFFWVPGTWVEPPRPGLLWTPGYWVSKGNVYSFHPGYWDHAVGFYGGVDYGYGYYGQGFIGGYWRGETFFYNRAAANINNPLIADVYARAIDQEKKNNVGYDGGSAGVSTYAGPKESDYAPQSHIRPTAVQDQHFATAIRDRTLRASINHGRPPVAATPRPGDFEGPGVVRPRT